MSGKIFIEAKPIILGGINTGYYHAYLVYQNTAGHEFVIRGGPQKDLFHPFGFIQTELGVPISLSEDFRDPSQAMLFGRKELDLNGRNAAEVWTQMQNMAEIIPNLYPYRPLGVEDSVNQGILFGNQDYASNSNSTVAALLQSQGIDPLAYLPTNVTPDQLAGFFRPLNLPSRDNDAFYTAPRGIPGFNADNSFFATPEPAIDIFNDSFFRQGFMLQGLNTPAWSFNYFSADGDPFGPNADAFPDLLNGFSTDFNWTAFSGTGSGGAAASPFDLTSSFSTRSFFDFD